MVEKDRSEGFVQYVSALRHILQQFYSERRTFMLWISESIFSSQSAVVLLKFILLVYSQLAETSAHQNSCAFRPSPRKSSIQHTNLLLVKRYWRISEISTSFVTNLD
jgi:hypothetical protein